MRFTTTVFVKMFILVALLSAVSATGCKKYKLQIASQQDEIDRLKNENSQLGEQLETANGNAADLEAAIKKLKAQIKKLGQQIAALEAEKKQIIKDNEQVLAKLKDKEKILKDLKKKQELARKRLAVFKRMLKKFKALIAGGKLKIKIKNGKLVLQLPSAILFDSGKAVLSDDGKETLQEVAAVLAKIKNREFQIVGHTDNVPMKSGRYPSNWELSTSRAVAVVKFLEKNKVSPKSLSAAGYSQYQPETSNDTAAGKAQNRRIEIVLMPNLDELPDLSALEKQLK